MGAEPPDFRSQASIGASYASLGGRGPGLFHRRDVTLSPDVLVSCGRVVTAAFGLLAIWLDPTRPSGDVENVQIVLSAYLAFSFLMLGLTSFLDGKAGPPRWLTHAVDIAALSILVLFSEELDSPFFVFFTFTLITAALQWGMGGILATALALQILLATSALPDLRDGDSELNILIMRSAYCWVSAVMLGYFATYRERMRNRLAKLAAWQPEGAIAEKDSAFGHSLDGSLEILGARQVVVLWKSVGAANGFAVVRGMGACEAAQPIAGGLVDDLRALPATVVRSKGLLSARDSNALDLLAPFVTDGKHPFRWRAMCTTKLRSRRHEGAVIVIDGAGEKEQLTALADIVTLRIAAHLEQRANADEQADAAGLRERDVLARDLHDGVLQHLTAAAIHLKVARSDPAVHPERLATIAEILLNQQQQIRRFVEGARTFNTYRSQPLERRLRGLAATLANDWGCAVALQVTPKTLHLDQALVTELCLLLSEAAANAVRHGQARNIAWTVRAESGSLLVTILDDGCGLAGSGEEQIVPRSLSARVAMLGGTLEIVSSTAGVLIRMRLALKERVP